VAGHGRRRGTRSLTGAHGLRRGTRSSASVRLPGAGTRPSAGTRLLRAVARSPAVAPPPVGARPPVRHGVRWRPHGSRRGDCPPAEATRPDPAAGAAVPPGRARRRPLFSAGRPRRRPCLGRGGLPTVGASALPVLRRADASGGHCPPRRRVARTAGRRRARASGVPGRRRAARTAGPAGRVPPPDSRLPSLGRTCCRDWLVTPALPFLPGPPPDPPPHQATASPPGPPACRLPAPPHRRPGHRPTTSPSHRIAARATGPPPHQATASPPGPPAHHLPAPPHRRSPAGPHRRPPAPLARRPPAQHRPAAHPRHRPDGRPPVSSPLERSVPDVVPHGAGPRVPVGTRTSGRHGIASGHGECAG
jgi:hypothetical protein